MSNEGHVLSLIGHFFGVPTESIFGGVKIRPHLSRIKQELSKLVCVGNEVKLGLLSPDMGVQTPSSPSGKGAFLLTFKCCFPPSFGFPPKSFPLEREPTILGETFGARARLLPRTAPQRSRHVMPLAMRPLREESGALPAHYSSSARHSHGRRLLRLRSE